MLYEQETCYMYTLTAHRTHMQQSMLYRTPYYLHMWSDLGDITNRCSQPLLVQQNIACCLLLKINSDL